MIDSVHLQYVGRVKAKPAKDFRIGEKMMWNGGSTTEVVSVVKTTAKFITYGLRDDESGPWVRRLKKDRLVAIG